MGNQITPPHLFIKREKIILINSDLKNKLKFTKKKLLNIQCIKKFQKLLKEIILKF